MFGKQKRCCSLQRINMCAKHALLITPLTPPSTLVDNDITYVISPPHLPPPSLHTVKQLKTEQ